MSKSILAHNLWRIFSDMSFCRKTENCKIIGYFEEYIENSRKLYFGPILNPFRLFLGKEEFLKNIHFHHFFVSRFPSLRKISTKTKEQIPSKTGCRYMDMDMWTDIGASMVHGTSTVRVQKVTQVHKWTYFQLRQQLLGWEYYHWAGIAVMRGGWIYFAQERIVISRGLDNFRNRDWGCGRHYDIKMSTY